MEKTDETPEEIEVTCTVSVRVKFKDYGDLNANALAIKQIKVWIEETLSEEDQVPLFVSSSSGEQSTFKRVLCRIDTPT